MDCAGVTDYLAGWIRDRVLKSGAGGILVGISGGVDSAVVAALWPRFHGVSWTNAQRPQRPVRPRALQQKRAEQQPQGPAH